MSNVGLMLKTQFKNNFRIDRSGKKTGKKSKQILMAGLYVFLVLYMLGVYVLLANEIMNAAVSFGYPQLVMDLVIMAAMGLTALLGIFVVLSSVFMAKDTQLLSTLPVTPRQIFLSKFLYVYLIETAISALFILPATVLYMIKVGGGVTMLLRAIYISLLASMAPLVLSSILVSLLMLVIGRLKHRDLFITIGSFLILIGVLAGQLWLQAQMGSGEGETDFFLTMFENHWSQMRSIVQPPISWGACAIYGGSTEALLGVVCFTLTAIIAFAIVWLVCGLVFRYAMSVNAEGSKSSKKVSADKLADDRRTPLRALLAKEAKTLFRSPIYITNGLSHIIVIAFLLLIPLVKGMGTTLGTLVKELFPGHLVALVICGVLMLMASMNAIPFTAASREGRSFNLLRSIPVDPTDLYTAKLIFGLLSDLAGGVLVVIGLLAYGVPVLPTLVGFALGMLGCMTITGLGCMIDFSRPKINWINEAEAMKNNTNYLFAMLIGLLVTGVMALLVWVLEGPLGAPSLVTLGFCAVVLAAGSLFFPAIAIRAGRIYFRKAE